MLTREQVKDIPSSSGVYLFKKGSQIFYIGKSVSLKTRILSHLENAKLDPKEALIINNSDSIEYIVTDSEFKALLLESSLIQKHQPKYNSRWKDDKSYLYIKIAVKEDFPKIFVVRKENNPKSLYYGPFPSQKDAEKILSLLRKLFPFCRQKKTGKRPCFYSKIGLCKPCPGKVVNLENPTEKRILKKIYRKNIFSVKAVLEGKVQPVLNSLFKELKLLTKQSKYEEAIVLRNKIIHFENLINQSRFSDNITIHFNRSSEAVNSLLNTLKSYFPELSSLGRIEGYDISNLFQKDATASMVVFSNGMPDKSQYKRFKIKSEVLKSDFDMLEEVFERRLKQSWPLPNLIIIDGGTPQVLTLKKIINLQPSILHFPILGIAKNPDRLVIAAEDKIITLRPSFNDLGFNLIRSVRDEAHRFARKYHLFLRNKRMML